MRHTRSFQIGEKFKIDMAKFMTLILNECLKTVRRLIQRQGADGKCVVECELLLTRDIAEVQMKRMSSELNLK